MSARQVGVPLVPGRMVVEVRDAVDGWTERVEVESDGRTVLSGLPFERIRIAPVRTTAPGAEILRTAVQAGNSGAGATLDRAYALCLWVGARAYAGGERRLPVVAGAGAATSGEGRQVLASIDAGGDFNCLSLATLYVDAARASGLVVRRIDLAVRDRSAFEGHSVAEVWDSDHRAWVLVDPTYGLYYTVDGAPASALDVHRALGARRFHAIGVVRADDAEAVDPWTNPINPLFYFRNVYRPVEGGPWLRYAGEGAAPAAIARHGFVQTDSAALFELPPDFEGDVPVQRGSVRKRIVAQALNGVLYVCLVDDLFAPGRFYVRTSSSVTPSFTDDVEGYDSTDDDLLDGPNLAPNPTFADGDGDGIPDSWEVDAGTPRFTWTGAGELVVEAGDEPCLLSGVAAGAEAVTVAATLRARVDRGLATLSVRKRRGAESLEIPPGAMLDRSPILLAPSRVRFRLRLELAPNTRCVLESLSLRRERLFGDVLPRPVAPRGGTAVAVLLSIASRAPVSNSATRGREQVDARRDDDDGKRDDGGADRGAEAAVSRTASGEAGARVEARPKAEVRGASVPGRWQARGPGGPRDRR
jgi:hypothetical protein